MNGRTASRSTRRRPGAATSPQSTPGSSKDPGYPCRSSGRRLCRRWLRDPAWLAISAARAVSTDEPGLDADRITFGRGSLGLQLERPFGRVRLVARSSLAAAVGPDLPVQEFVYLGGPTTAPGYEFHELVGGIGASQRVEGRVAVPFPAFSLGRYGSTGNRRRSRPSLIRPTWHACRVLFEVTAGQGGTRRLVWAC
jgi:hypothetical protein